MKRLRKEGWEFYLILTFITAAIIVLAAGRGAFAQEPATFEAWSGCFERVVVIDEGIPRIFERREEFLTTMNGKPGTGQWGEWRECFPHEPGVKSFSYDSRAWPRMVDQKELAWIFKPQVWAQFAKRREARVSQRYNLTGNPAWGDWF